jgi:nucleotide-binding universal stress UspA family protein
LIATDGSENSAQAINAGMEIARLSNGKAYALHVIDTNAYPSGRGDPKWARLIEEQSKIFGLEITSAVEEAAKAAEVDVEFVTLEGHPAEKNQGFCRKTSC